MKSDPRNVSTVLASFCESSTIIKKGKVSRSMGHFPRIPENFQPKGQNVSHIYES